MIINTTNRMEIRILYECSTGKAEVIASVPADTLTATVKYSQPTASRLQLNHSVFQDCFWIRHKPRPREDKRK